MRGRASQICASMAAFVVLAAWPRACEGAEALPFERGDGALLSELMMARTGCAALLAALSLEDADLALAVHLRRNLGFETHICFPRRDAVECRGSGKNGRGSDFAREEEAARMIGARIWRLGLPHVPRGCSTEEARVKWRSEEAVAEFVRTIRRVAPSIVVVCNDTKKDDGAGAALASLAAEAFDAAANPAKFPAHGGREGFRAWEAAKLYVRTFDPLPSDLQIETNRIQPLCGTSPAGIGFYARRLLSAGKAPGVEPVPGMSYPTWYRRVKSRLDTTDSADMADGLKRMPDEGFPGCPPQAEGKHPPGSVAAAIASIGSGDKDRADAVLAALVNARDVRDRLLVASAPPAIRAAFDRRLAHLGEAAGIVLGLRLRIKCDPPLIAPGGSAKVEIRFDNEGILPVVIRGILLPHAPALKVAPVAIPPEPVAPGKTLTAATEVKAAEGAALVGSEELLRVALNVSVEHKKYPARFSMTAPAELAVEPDGR